MKNLILLLSLLLVPGTLHADVLGFSDGTSSKPFTSKDLIPKLEKNQAYSERYTFSALLDDGGEIYLEMTISNFGWGDYSAATTTRVELAGESPYEHKETMKAEEWSYSPSRFQVTMGTSSAEAAREGVYRLKHRGDIEYDLEFRNILPAWRPGNGEVRVGDDYFRLGLIAPRASVTGRVKLGERWIDVSSRQGMADWSVTTIAPFDLASEFGRFRALRGDTYVAWRNIKLAESHGGKDISWVVVGKGSRIIFADADATIQRSKMKRDRKSGYDVPYAVTVHGRSGEDRLTLELTASRYKVLDLLDSYGTLTRFLAARFTKPFQFNSFASWRLELSRNGDPETKTGRGPLGIDILND